jgi:DNA-binding transcriptional LysR family regulator
MPSLDLLATFFEIYRTGSLSAAAARLGVTQPAVTGQLARLEAEVGGQLFVRSRQGAAPTARAAALAGRIGAPLEALRDALATTAEPPAVTGTVRIGGASDVMALRVLPALAPLLQAGLQCDVRLGSAHALLSDLADDRLDLVVSSIRPPSGGVMATPFVDEEFVLVGAPALAHTVDAARLATDPVAALAHLPLTAYAEDLPVIRRYWRSEFGRRPPNPVAAVVPDLRAACALVVAAVGVTVLPEYVASADLEAGRLVRLHTPELAPLNTLYLVVRRSAPPLPALAVVQQHLLEVAAEWGSL